MLTEFKGAANSREIFQYLVGETITAAFINDEGRVVIVCASGAAIEFGSMSGLDGPKSPVYWKVGVEDLKRMIEKRRGDIERKLNELRDLPGVVLS